MTTEYQQLSVLPFPQQIEKIDEELKQLSLSDDSPKPLLTALASFPDHEPLAHALRVLIDTQEGVLLRPENHQMLSDLLFNLPDTGVRRVLRGLEQLILSQETLGHLAQVALETMTRWPMERIAIICLADRWLKNAAPNKRQVWLEALLQELRTAIEQQKIDTIQDQYLLHLPGKQSSTFSDLAQKYGCLESWNGRLAAFAKRVLLLMRKSPRSLSQANAEELLSKRVYTDPGHFLIELFQNAEDAQAERFTVELNPAEAAIRHDGVPFDAKDVVGVLSIGQTTKAREQIGFFGVGFKSVYGICERPQIYSDLFSFEIADVSIPRGLAMHPSRADKETLLLLPYRPHNDVQKTNTERKQMFKRALAVPPETLLTLEHLHTFSVACDGQRRTVIRRNTKRQRIIELHIKESETSAFYHITEGRFAYDGPQRELSRAMETSMLLAIAIDERGKPQALSDEQPTLFSHLPTDERSGLRLLIHAHFELPVDRERLDLSSPWNRWALAKAGTLMVNCITQLCEEVKREAPQSQQTLAGILEVLPLPSELKHVAYQGLLQNLQSGVSRQPMFQAANCKTWLRPAHARLLDEPILLEVLAGVPFDEQGTQICTWLEGRHRQVALFLGASSLQASELVELLESHLSDLPSDASWPEPWLTNGHRALLDSLGRMLKLNTHKNQKTWAQTYPKNKALLSRLSGLCLLPDQRGLPRSPKEIWHASPKLRALYGKHRNFLNESMLSSSTPGETALLQALRIEKWTPKHLLLDLEEPETALQLLAHAGSLSLHAYLSQLDKTMTEHLGLLPLFPTISKQSENPEYRMLLADTNERAWLVPDDDFLSWLLSLENGCPHLVSPALCAAQRAYLQHLGGETLDLSACLELLREGHLLLSTADIEELHKYLEIHISECTTRQHKQIAEAPLFFDKQGIPHPLLGQDRVYLSQDDAVLDFAPNAPWIAEKARKYSYIKQLPVPTIGPQSVIRLLCNDQVGDLYDPNDLPTLRRAYKYLRTQHENLLPKELNPLSQAPIWLDQEGQRHSLSALQAPIKDPDVGILFAAFDMRSTIEQEAECSAFETVEQLGLGTMLFQPDMALLFERLPLAEVDWLATPVLREALHRLLPRAMQQLPDRQLAPLLSLPIFTTADGQMLSIGDWTTRDFSSKGTQAHRAGENLRKVLAHGSTPLLHADEESLWKELLTSLRITKADIGVLVTALEEDPQMTSHQAATDTRNAFVAMRGQIPMDEDFRKRITQLSIWPAEDGTLLPTSALLVPREIHRLLGNTLQSLLVDGEHALLAEEAWEQAEALAEIFSFDAPIEYLLIQLRTSLLPDASINAQPSPFCEFDTLLQVLALLCEHRHLDLVLALPLSIDVDNMLRKGPLWQAEGDALVLAKELPLRGKMASTNWLEQATQINPNLVKNLSSARLLREIMKFARDTNVSKESMDALCGRGAFGRWLETHLPGFVDDPQLSGSLGKTPLIKTAAGTYKSPRSLLWGVSKNLSSALGLDDWCCHKDLPTPLQQSLQRHYQLEDTALDKLIGVLAEAHLQAQAQEDAPRSVTILQAIAEALPLSNEMALSDDWLDSQNNELTEAQQVMERLIRKHKLARLRVETTDGSFERIARLVFPVPAHQPLLNHFLETPIRQIHPRYDTPILRHFFTSLGAPIHLPIKQLKALLRGEGRTEGLEAQLAFAKYLVHLIDVIPALQTLLLLTQATWITDGEGVAQMPSSLYWPSPEAFSLLGETPRLFPHPDFFRTVPEHIAQSLPFLQTKQAQLDDVLAHLHKNPGGASFDMLQWFENRLRDKSIPQERVKEAFSVAPYLRDNDGFLQFPEALICTPAKAWIGEMRGVWSDGLRFSKLASTLGIPHRVRPTEVFAYGRAIRKRMEEVGLQALLLEAPELQEQLPRCLALLGERKAPPVEHMPIFVTNFEGSTNIVAASEPTLTLPTPSWLIDVASEKDLALWIPIMARNAEEVSSAWLRKCGVLGLDALLEPSFAEKEALNTAHSSMPTLINPSSEVQTAIKQNDSQVEKTQRNNLKKPEHLAPQKPKEKASEKGIWSRFKQWWEDETQEQNKQSEASPQRQTNDSEVSASQNEPTQNESMGGNRQRQARLPQAEEHGRWFRARPTIESQLKNDGLQWLSDRTQKPQFGFSFAPTSLPYPHSYAPQLLTEHFQKNAQSWRTSGMPSSWRKAAETEVFRIALNGRIPAGENLFPLPLYANLSEVRAEGVKVIKANNGQVFLMARTPTEMSCSVTLNQAPIFEKQADDRSLFANISPALLASFVPDSELPIEVLDWLDEQLDQPLLPLERALAVRTFIQTNYCYDPSYIEDPAIAEWLARVSRGRANIHIAALHAGRDHKHLGRGVCYELGALACELLRRLGIPAAVCTGWTWERGQLADADHMWAMALLPSDIGPRWLPIDPSTTREGRPLRVAHRPQGSWEVKPPKQRNPRPSEPSWGKRQTPPSERPSSRDDASQGASNEPSNHAPQQGRSEFFRQMPKPKRSQPKPTSNRQRNAPRKPPIAELIRVIRHIQRISGETPENAQELREICETLLQNPQSARRLLSWLEKL